MVATGLDPRRHRGVVFDVDGVITNTAAVHAAAWKRMFDDYVAERPPAPGEDHRPFSNEDYVDHVDGKRRIDGVRDFLNSRGISLPLGGADDVAGAHTAHGLGKLKDRYFTDSLASSGTLLFEDVVPLVEALREHGVRTAVVSASRNCRAVLSRAGAEQLFDVLVDGVLADDLGLPGKPDPAIFLKAARRLDLPASACVVVEDASVGVRAGRRGEFGRVIGIARFGPPNRLVRAGADVVVSTLADITVTTTPDRRLSEVGDAHRCWDEIAQRLRGRRVVLVLDFDGTLSPICDDPAGADMSPRTRDVLQRLSRSIPVAVLSGRDLQDVRHRVGLEDLWYAGSHGFELAAPGGETAAHGLGEPASADLDEAERLLGAELREVPGAEVDRKRFALAVHYRHVEPGLIGDVLSAVDRVGRSRPTLRVAHGRQVVELVPDVEWNKGWALRWLLKRMGPASAGAVPVFAGDDYTDENALHEIHHDGVGVVVRSAEHGDRLTWAHYAVNDPCSLTELLAHLASLAEGGNSDRS
ncbi:trehalose-phosphatase [Saccharopolyspora rhizosphaerae]|uniref:Trehalose 6-phosphate phosphatase n=1 Tax=Saccharopolyspora rhizosphaerae TaxID=2492662 RepID=A0A3R8P2J2_9PSEU|nr:trehalose-phosphatase [Saccharopolyspora rhizosphaerae]RRO18647.1 trehalose-phosphatase [Saccharopolyspora rhizosphaerae]